MRHTILSVLLSLGMVPAAAHAQFEPERAADVAASPDALPAAAPAKPPIHWSKAALRELLAAVDASRDEGLRPEDYHRDALAAAVAGGRAGTDIDSLAEDSARALAHDYADGRIGGRERFDWHIDHSPAALLTLTDDVDRAVEDGRLQSYLRSLLPQDPRYAALRDALRATADTDIARRTALRASMERWRWMPRTLAPDYLMVNVPAYRVTLFRDEMPVAEHDVVVGARKTPTPMILTYASSVIVNPWWTLPPSVLSEGGRYPAARGFVKTEVNGRTVVRQKPGPRNALGRMKFNMANPYAIYLHDTPAQAAFAKPMRALSHGCIRVKDIAGLADELTDGVSVETALDGQTTRTVQLEKSVPVYIVYFTADQQDGRVVTYGDPYGRDKALAGALDGQPVQAATYTAAAI